VICYCIFKGDPNESNAGPFVEIQDQSGLPLDGGVQMTPHPTLPGLWRLGPFYVPDNAVSEFSIGVI
jgi:hypothetical protein